MTNDREAYLFPATYGQEQIWYLTQLAPDSTAYTIAFAFELRGPLDREALARAIAALVRRHDALRTGIAMLDDGLRQVVHATVDVELGFDALESLPPADRAARVAAWRQRFARRRFDLESESLFAAHLLRVQPQEHLLLVAVHHIVVDHLSVLQLGRELGELYEACRQGTEPADDERLQFGDYAVWQREQLTEAALAERLSYWTDALAGRRQSLDLPTDRPRGAVQTFAGDEVAVAFDPALSAALRQYAQRRRQSLFMVVMAGLAVVLHRYSGQRDITLGSPFANRPGEDVAEVVGLFMNVLPVPLDVEPAQPFEALLGQVRRQMTKAQALQDTPFERIVQAVRQGADASANPLVQVGYTFQDAPMALQLPGLEVRSESLHNGGSKFDLSLWCWDDGERIRGLVEFNTDLFEARTARRLVDHVGAVLARAIADDAAPIATLALLTEAEHAALRVERDRVAVPVPLDTLHGAFFDRARREPGRTALLTAAHALSAGDLAARAETCARRLQARGIGPGDVVGVCLGRDSGLVAALLGVLRCGAAYLPLDPALPIERLGYMVADAHARLVIAGEATRGPFDGLDVPVLDPSPVSADAVPASASWPQVAAADPAYLIYTSGSTGRPKGVRISHGAAANFLHAMAQRPGITDTDVVLATTTVGFDISVLEIFLPLAVGATVVLADRAQIEDAADLARLVDQAGITLMQATPSTWRTLRAVGWPGRPGLRALCGGEPLTPELAGWLLPRVAALWNMYGPTETTVWSACAAIDTSNAAWCPVGTAIANTTLHVVDPGMRLLPDGVPGELAIGGAGLALGYQGLEALTRDRFTTLPETGERVYRTGDRAVRRPDGDVVLHGRLDGQIKLRGHRIEPGEIEAVVAAADGVAAAVVRDWRLSEDDHRLVAYVTGRDGAVPDVTALRAQARRLLPAYMVPQHWVVLASLPVTPSGKVDRARLPPPDVTADPPEAPAASAVAPTAHEALVREVCLALIGQPAIDLDRTFFDAGGHSLLALRFAVQIEQRTGIRLPLLRIADSTLRALAAELAQAPVQAQAAAAPMGGRLSRWLRSALGR
jgi:amino acid adenylation domain-containing protein